MKRFIKDLGVNLVGADVVEVNLPYDMVAEATCIAATDVLVDVMALMAKDEVRPHKSRMKDEL